MRSPPASAGYAADRSSRTLEKPRLDPRLQDLERLEVPLEVVRFTTERPRVDVPERAEFLQAGARGCVELTPSRPLDRGLPDLAPRLLEPRSQRG